MRILFGQSYYLRFDPKLWAAMQPYPPLGTLYAAGYLREQGYDVACFDAMLADSEARWAEALDRYRPDLAVIYEDSFNYLTKMCLLRMRQAAFTMTRMAKERGLAVVVGGSDVTDNAPKYLAQGADWALIGEGEITLAELTDHLAGRSAARREQIPGLAYVESGQVHYTGARPIITNLDSLPFPAWDLVDMARYQEVWHRKHGYHSMNMVTARGCPHHCAWCAKPIWGQRYNARSPENVVAELQALKDAYHPDHIWFTDDTMGLNTGWLPRFARLVGEAHVRTPFKCLSRPDLLLRDGAVDALQQAGCRTVWIGAESGSQSVLDAMEKGTRVEQIYEVTDQLHAAGIQVAFFIQFGYPGETRHDIELTRRMVRECQPDDIGISVSYPLPGTPFYERVKAQLGERQNWLDSDELAMLYQGPFSSDFYRQLHTVLHKEFRLRKSWAELRRLAHDPRELDRRRLRQAGVLLYQAVNLPWARRRLDRLQKLAPTRGR